MKCPRNIKEKTYVMQNSSIEKFALFWKISYLEKSRGSRVLFL